MFIFFNSFTSINPVCLIGFAALHSVNSIKQKTFLVTKNVTKNVQIHVFFFLLNINIFHSKPRMNTKPLSWQDLLLITKNRSSSEIPTH